MSTLQKEIDPLQNPISKKGIKRVYNSISFSKTKNKRKC